MKCEVCVGAHRRGEKGKKKIYKIYTVSLSFAATYVPVRQRASQKEEKLCVVIIYIF